MCNGGPWNPKLTLKVNGLWIKIKAQNFASQVLSKHTLKIWRKKEGVFFYHRGTLSVTFKVLLWSKNHFPFFFRFWKCLLLSFDFYPQAVFFGFKFWISRSTITCIQNWLSGPQWVGSREKWRQRLTSLKFQRVNAAYCICKIKVWKPETPVLHINRPFATNDHMVQNPPCWRASSLLFPHWDIKTKRPEPVKLDVPLF